MDRWQAIIFDLDDTLYPERDYVLSGFRAVAAWAQAQLGVPAAEAFDDLQRLFATGVRGNTFDRWLADRGLPPDDIVPRMIRVYRDHEPTLVPFQEAAAVLSELRQCYRLALLSDGHLAVQRRKLAALGLHDHFYAVVFSDQLGRDAWKPSLKPFLAVLQQLGIEARHTVYVADNPLKDFLGARRARISSIRVRRPEGEYAHLEPPTAEHAPDLTIDSLLSLPQALAQLE